MPISMALTSRILDVITFTLVCRRMTGPGHQFAVSQASQRSGGCCDCHGRSPRQTIASRGCNIPENKSCITLSSLNDICRCPLQDIQQNRRGDVKRFVSAERGADVLVLVFVIEDREEDAIHRGSIREDAHWPSAPSHFAKAPFN